MFRNFNKLIPEMVKYSELRQIIKQRHIPLNERWECRDFKIKEKKFESYEEFLEKIIKKSDIKLLTK